MTDQTNRFRYNSKEEQSSLYPTAVRNAISYIDYGARQYDPVLGRWFAQDPLSEKYYSISPYAFCGNNPVRYEEIDGEDWVDKAVGYFIGGATNLVPGTGFMRDWYTPDNSADYNSALRRTDNAAATLGVGMQKVGTGTMAAGGAVAATGVGITVSSAGAGVIVGGPAVAVGAEIAGAGAATAVTGTMLVMNASKNKSDGYERGKGNTSSGNKNMKHANPKARESAAKKYEEAKAKYKELKSKTNKSKEDNKLKKYFEKQMSHWKRHMDFPGENHSQTVKGN